jgi:sugar phosphate isomerase/epimerase
VCLDAFHINIEEADPYASIRKAGSRLADFHVADTNRMACGMGHWDWPKLIGTLKEIGYDGALTVEFVAPLDRTPANPYPEAVEKEPVDISPEQKKFIEEHGSTLLSEKFFTWLVDETTKTLLPLIR